MKVVRGEDPGPFTRPREYVTFLQVAFNCRCAYCLTPDCRLGGMEAMKVDHFRPESRYQELRIAWSNLYYCCDVCNNRKSDHPTANEEERGRHFVDICQEDADDHFQLALDSATGDYCRVTHLTEAAKYTIYRLHFNRRPFLRDFWREIQACERRTLGQLKSAVVLRNLIGATDSEAIQLITELERQLDRIRALLPFPLG